MHFEAFEQTLRLRLVSGPVDKRFFIISRNSLSRTLAEGIKYHEVCVRVTAVIGIRSLRRGASTLRPIRRECQLVSEAPWKTAGAGRWSAARSWAASSNEPLANNAVFM